MPRYVDAESLKVFIKRHWLPSEQLVAMLCAIDGEPTADVQEVKKGKWEYHGNDIVRYCTVCGNSIPVGDEFYYCPHCGSENGWGCEINEQSEA